MTKFLGLLLISCVASAANINWEQILQDMEENGLDSVEIEYGDDSEEGRGIMTNSKGNDRCSCSAGNACGCCARPHLPMIGKHQLCVNATVVPTEKTFAVGVELDAKTVINHKFSIAAADRICDRLPSVAENVKVCLYTDTKDLPNQDGIMTCAKLDFIYGEQKLGKIKFACVQFKDGHLSLNDLGDVKAKDMYVFKVHNPFKG